MADDNRSLRSHDPYARAPADAHDTAADPLAELARLIGQTDPFSDSARGAPTAQQPTMLQDAAPVGDWRRHIERPNYEAMPDEQPLPADPHYQHHDFERDPPMVAAGYADEQSYQSDTPYAQGHVEPYAMAPHAAAATDSEAYDDPPRRRTGIVRGGVGATVALFVCCALIGTAGAYGYRHFVKPTSSAAKQAPVIVADTSPSKVVPPAPEPKAPVRSQERVEQEGGERLVSREEQPVSLQQPTGGGSPPRVVFPPLPQNPPAAAVPAAAPPAAAPAAAAPAAAPPAAAPPAATASVAPPATPNEPKRVRTVTIRPDGSDASSRPGAPARTRTTTAPPAVPSTPAARGGPLSLDPSAPAEAQASEPARPQRRAATAPAPRDGGAGAPRDRDIAAGAPREGSGARLAAAPSNGSSSNGGGYIVQVSSQRSEADARASYRGLQAKYPQLKSRQPIIRRADLGKKGTFYRAMVGPFASTGEADQFCGGLKRAGGQCIILRN